MGVFWRADSLAAGRQEQIKLEQVREMAQTMFVCLAQATQLSDQTVAMFPDVFEQWRENWTGLAGSIVQEAGVLYRSIHDVLTVAQNTRPSATPAMWTRIGDPAAQWPEWIQPLGAHDAYEMGAHVLHCGKHWVSQTGGNVWEPGVYGWREQE